MKNLKLNIALIVFVGFGLSSCNKYEDGKAINLSSKKSRVENTWKIGQALRNGEDVTSDYDEFTLFLSKDGDAQLAALYTFGNFSYETDTDGTWEFKSNKENLYLDFDDDEFDKTYQILKLEKEDLWLREIGGEDELHLVSK
jgi:hypothetical protein